MIIAIGGIVAWKLLIMRIDRRKIEDGCVTGRIGISEIRMSIGRSGGIDHRAVQRRRVGSG